MSGTQSNGNGHSDDEPETSTEYTHLQDDVWSKVEEDRISLTDGLSVKDEIDDDEDDQSDSRN